jgi:hypothetical protein
MADRLSRRLHGALAATLALLVAGCQSAVDDLDAAGGCRRSLSTLAPILATGSGDLPCYLPARPRWPFHS